MVRLLIIAALLLSGCQSTRDNDTPETEVVCDSKNAEWVYRDDGWGLAVCDRFYPIPGELIYGNEY